MAKDLALDGLECSLDLRELRGRGKLIFGASKGINVVGIYEASCWCHGV